MEKKDFINIGVVKSVNRKTGDLSVVFDMDAPQIPDELEILFLDIDGGLVPFFIAEMGSVSGGGFRVNLQDYSGPDVAARFVGLGVYLELAGLPVGEEAPFNYYDVIGYDFYDEEKGYLGKIQDVVKSPMQLLLQVMHNDTEILVPFVEEFFVAVNREEKTLKFDLPDGLIDLYLDK